MLTKTRRFRIVVLLLLMLALSLTQVQASLPPCGEREFIIDLPRANSDLWCLEQPLVVAGGELALTAIAYDAAGALYGVSPLAGTLLHLRDSDGDDLPDTVDVLAEGLRRPNGLAVHDEALYIIGDGIVYRYADATLTTITDALPAGRGFVPSGIAVDEDLLYIGIPFPCDVCIPHEERYGTVMQLALDGSEMTIVARGLRYPAGLTLYDGALWVTDSARDDLLLIGDALDELNRIDLNADAVPHFGFPYCVGDQQPDIAGDFDCAESIAPVLRFETGSTPLSLAPYLAPVFPWLQDELLVVLRGSPDNARIRGYGMYSLQLDVTPPRYEAIMPADQAIAGDARGIYDATTGLVTAHTATVNRRGAGVWPHHAFDVAVSPQGWMMMSVGGGQLYVLRPGDLDVCAINYRECD